MKTTGEKSDRQHVERVPAQVLNPIDRITIALLRTVFRVRRLLRRAMRASPTPRPTETEIETLWADLDAAVTRKFGDDDAR